MQPGKTPAVSERLKQRERERKRERQGGTSRKRTIRNKKKEKKMKEGSQLSRTGDSIENRFVLRPVLLSSS